MLILVTGEEDVMLLGDIVLVVFPSYVTVHCGGQMYERQHPKSYKDGKL